jgi:hypothetical protein
MLRDSLRHTRAKLQEAEEDDEDDEGPAEEFDEGTEN